MRPPGGVEAGGASSTGPPEMVTTGPLRNKNEESNHTPESANRWGCRCHPPSVTQFLWQRPELVPSYSMAPKLWLGLPIRHKRQVGMAPPQAGIRAGLEILALAR